MGAWSLSGLPDPRPKAGSLKESLCHPAELAAAAAMTKEQLALESAWKKRRQDGQTPGWQREVGAAVEQEPGAGSEEKAEGGKGPPPLR